MNKEKRGKKNEKVSSPLKIDNIEKKEKGYTSPKLSFYIFNVKRIQTNDQKPNKKKGRGSH
jgi:hypothetical protein